MEKPTHVVANLIEQFDANQPNFRPTEIYNEEWMLKAFLHQASKVNIPDSPFSFLEGADWFSEAMLPTAFKARNRGDKRAESRTNADGVIGHFEIGNNGKADFTLKKDATQFVVVEAKMNSKLSPGITNAPHFDQAARNVACMAEVLRIAEIKPDSLKDLKFIVLAPKKSIVSGNFTSELAPKEMRKKIKDRVAMFGGELDDWHQNWAKPTLEAITIEAVSWEDAIEIIKSEHSKIGSSLDEFYDQCMSFN